MRLQVITMLHGPQYMVGSGQQRVERRCVLVRKKGYKRLTNAEKKFNKEITAKLRDKGVIPPVKPKLNRIKFAKEVIQEYKEELGNYDDIRHLFRAISFMLPMIAIQEKGLRVKISPEEIGVLKMIKIAVEIKKFESDLTAKGETKYSSIDLYKVAVEPVIKL